MMFVCPYARLSVRPFVHLSVTNFKPKWLLFGLWIEPFPMGFQPVFTDYEPITNQLSLDTMGYRLNCTYDIVFDSGNPQSNRLKCTMKMMVCINWFWTHLVYEMSLDQPWMEAGISPIFSSEKIKWFEYHLPRLTVPFRV